MEPSKRLDAYLARAKVVKRCKICEDKELADLLVEFMARKAAGTVALPLSQIVRDLVLGEMQRKTALTSVCLHVRQCLGLDTRNGKKRLDG